MKNKSAQNLAKQRWSKISTEDRREIAMKMVEARNAKRQAKLAETVDDTKSTNIVAPDGK